MKAAKLADPRPKQLLRSGKAGGSKAKVMQVRVMKAMRVTRAMKAMKKASMKASMKKASMKASMKMAAMAVSPKMAKKAGSKASDTPARTNSWHVDTEGIKEIWVDAPLISKRPPLNTDTIIFKVFPLMS